MHNPFEFSHPGLGSGAKAPEFGINIPPQLEKHGVTLPDDLIRRRSHLAALDARAKNLGNPGDVESRILAELHNDADAPLNAGLVDIATAELQRKAIIKAQFLDWQDHGQLLRRHADDLIRQLSITSFDQCVADIEAASELPTTDLAALAARKQTDAVLVVSAATQALARIGHLHRIRRDLTLSVGGFPQQNKVLDRFGNLLHWREPDNVIDDGGTLDAYIANMANGADPWFAPLADLAARRTEQWEAGAADREAKAEAAELRRSPSTRIAAVLR